VNIIIGHIGSDAGFIIIGPDGKITRVPGWQPEAMAEVTHALNVVAEAAQLKTPELAHATMKAAMDFVQKELNQHVKAGDVLVLR
jgi:hypothetical protein